MMKHKYIFAALAAFAFMFASPALADLPGPTSATFAKGAKFTVAGYAEGKLALTGFPVLVRISDGSPTGFQYSEMQHADATDKNDIDIAFVDMNGSGLPFEIDTWDPDGTSLIWVRLPSMQNGTEFVMCWGSSSSGKSVCNVNPWNEYAGVWHMGESGDGVVTIKDSTINGLDAETTSVSFAQPNGIIGGARTPTKNGNNKDANCIKVDLGDQSSTKRAVVDGINTEGNGHSFTVSMWVKPVKYDGNGTPQSQYLVGRKYEDTTGAWGVQYYWNNSSTDYSRIRTWGCETSNGADSMLHFNFDDSIIPSNAANARDKWYKFDIVYSGDTVRFYVNGGTNSLAVLSGTLKASPAGNGSGDLYLAGTANTGTREFEGDMDEVRLRGGAMTADWVAADYATQTDTSFLTPGTAEDYVENDNPHAAVTVASVAYTNVTLTATVVDKGGEAPSATVAVELSETSDFSSPLWSTNYTVNADGDVQSFLVTHLSCGTSYHVRMITENTLGGAVTNTPSFTTLTPGAPVGTAVLKKCGFTTLSVSGAATDFGTGAQSATLRLEASTDGFGSIAAASIDVPADGSEAAMFTVSGLTPDTAYALRLRIENDWGIVSYVSIGETSTLDVPFVASGIGYAFSSDLSTLSLSFLVREVFDGAQCTAEMTFGEAPVGSRSFSAPGTLAWSALTAPDSPTVATVVVAATVGGQTYEKTWTVTVRSSRQSTTVDDISDHVTAATALRMHVGDTATLPVLDGSDFYEIGNSLFASIEGTKVTALRPGIIGVHQRYPDVDGGTNLTRRTLAMIILPDPIPGGDIYILHEASFSGSSGIWTNPAVWEKLGSETRDSYPCRPDDIAIVPLCDKSSIEIDPQAADISFGALYVGGIKDFVQYNLSFNCKTDKHSVSFDRTDGEKALLQISSSATALGNNNYRTWVKFKNTITAVRCCVNTLFSGGFDGTSPTTRHGRIEWGAVTKIPRDITLELVEFDTQAQDQGGTMYIGKLSGQGIFWNHSSAMLRVDSDQTAFTGTWRDSGGHGAENQGQGRSAPIFFRTSSVANSSAETVGWVYRDGVNPTTSYNKGVGSICTGWPHTYGPKGPHDPWFPARGLRMHGGLVWNRVESSTWTGDITRDVRFTDRLTVGGGFDYIVSDSNSNYPTVVFESAALNHEDKASLYIKDSRIYGSSQGNMNTTTILRGALTHAVGAAGDPATTSVYPIVPWIATQAGPKAEEDMRFAAFDETGLLVRIDHATDKSKALSDYGANDNAYLWQRDISLSADATFNSLSLVNEAKEKKLGEGRTLTITSGGLILEDVSWMEGTSGIGTEDGGAANGRLVLGDATHPAYVWARGAATVTAKTGPNQIWASVTAPGGLVSAHTGNLLLGGDQTGIGDEIAVNAGSLQLGSSANSCQLAKDLPIRIYANATLKLPNASSTTGNILKFDGAAGWFGKVEVPEGVAAKCCKAYWRDYPETPEWQPIRRGVYTGDEATARSTGAIYDPDHFSGAGTVAVLKDNSTLPLLIIVR